MAKKNWRDTTTKAVATVIEKSIEEAVERALGRFVAQLEAKLGVQAAQAAQSDEYLTRKKAAGVAGVSARTIDAWIRDGSLARYGKGRMVRVKRSELALAMAQAAQPPKEIDIEKRAAAILSRNGRH